VTKDGTPIASQNLQAARLFAGQVLQLKKQGLGPREMRVGARVLISREAGRDWRRACEEAAAKAVAEATNEAAAA